MTYQLSDVDKKNIAQFKNDETRRSLVLEGLPPEGRFYLDSSAAGTIVIEGISPSFAAGRLSGASSSEVTIYLEDVNAKRLVHLFMDLEKRKRTRICEVGSHTAVISQMAARFIDGPSSSEAMCVLDGDQRAARDSHITKFLGAIPQKRRAEAESWINERLAFLPSDIAPERFVLSRMRSHHLSAFADRFGLDETEAASTLDKALLMGDHGELFWISEDVLFPQDQVWSDVCKVLLTEEPMVLSEIMEVVDGLLE